MAQRAASLLLLPLLLPAITPAEFGQLALLIAIAGAAGAVFSFGLEAAIVRAYFQLSDDPVERYRYLNTVGLFLLRAPATAWALAAPPLVVLAPADLPVGYLLLALAGAAVQVPATVLPLVVLRLEERLQAYVLVSLISTATNVVLSLVLVVGIGLGVSGWLTATLVANVVLLVAGLSVLGHRFTTNVSRRHLLAALAFGLPLLPHMLAHWGLSLSDRTILAAWVSRADLGIYNLGYQLAAPVGVLAVAVNQAIVPLMSRAAAPGGSSEGLPRVITTQVLTAAYLGMSVALLAPVVIDLLMPASYARSVGVVPWVALGYVFYGWYTVPMNALSITKGTTRWVWVATVTAAAVNIGLNLLLVPRWGITAAAVTTAIGYGTLLLTVSLLAYRSHALTLRFERPRVGGGVALVLLAYAAVSLTVSSTGVLGAALRGTLTAAVGVVVFGLATDLWPSALMRRGPGA